MSEGILPAPPIRSQPPSPLPPHLWGTIVNATAMPARQSNCRRIGIRWIMDDGYGRDGDTERSSLAAGRACCGEGGVYDFRRGCPATAPPVMRGAGGAARQPAWSGRQTAEFAVIDDVRACDRALGWALQQRQRPAASLTSSCSRTLYVRSQPMQGSTAAA